MREIRDKLDTNSVEIIEIAREWNEWDFKNLQKTERG